VGDKKHTTVTTIETHEVWVIRQVPPGPPDATEAVAKPDGAIPSTRAPADHAPPPIEEKHS